jgi:hypothetical protein
MAIHIQDLSRATPIPCINRAVAGVSGTVDMLGFGRALVIVQKEARSGQGGKVVARIGHGTSTVTYANSTAITGGILSTAAVSTAEYDCFNVDWTGKGRYLIVRTSAVTASTTHGVSVLKCEGDKIPPSSTGFTQYKNCPSNP